MSVLTIPVKSGVASYEFPIELERIQYTLRFRFNYRMARWIMDVATRDGSNIVCGIPLLTGYDMFSKYKDDRLPPGAFMVYDATGKMESPGFDELGSSVLLLYFESGTVT